MSHRYFSSITTDEARMEVVEATTALFNGISNNAPSKRLDGVFDSILRLSDLIQTTPQGLGVVMDEIGYLSGTTHTEYGAISNAFHTVAGCMFESYLEANDHIRFRHMQDGSHILLHLANVSLPHEPRGGITPEDAAPLRNSVKTLQGEATYDHVIQLSGVILHTLDWRETNHNLCETHKVSQEEALLHDVWNRASLYANMSKSAFEVLTTLTLDQMKRSPKPISKGL